MNTLEGSPLPEYCRQLLQTGDKEYARLILKDYFKTLDEQGPQEILWFMLTTAMKLDNEEVSGTERSNMIFFYDYTVALFKAAFALSKKEKETKKRKK